MMIVKVQLPLAGSSQAFVYNKDRTIEMEVHMSAVAQRFRKGEYKLYFEAALVDDGVLLIGERVPAQSW